MSLFLPASFASAQTTQDDLAPASQPAEQFPQGLWTLNLTSQYVTGVPDGKHDQIVGGSFGAGYYIFNRLGIVADIPVDYVDERGAADAVAGGFELLARFHFLEFDRWSLYADGGGAALLADNRVPQHGTNFNFTPQVGLGASYELNDNVCIIGGARLFHLSNASVDGARNPSIDLAVEGYVGLLWKL